MDSGNIPEIYCAVVIDFKDRGDSIRFHDLISVVVNEKLLKWNRSGLSVSIAIINYEKSWDLDKMVSKMFSNVGDLESIKACVKKCNGEVTIDIAFIHDDRYPALIISKDNISKIAYLEASFSIDAY